MTPKRTGETTGDVRAKVLKRALREVPFDGWTDLCLRKAGEALKIDPKELELLYPGGGLDLLEDFSVSLDDRMLEALEGADLAAMKIRERITFAVHARIEAMEAHREASLRAASLLALPIHGVLSTRLAARTVDLMWRGIGDTSVDFNWYTKRATLGLVYSSTLLVWINDESDDLAETWAFLDRRIENVMQFERAKFKVREKLAKLPDPFAVLAGVTRGVSPRRTGR